MSHEQTAISGRNFAATNPEIAAKFRNIDKTILRFESGEAIKRSNEERWFMLILGGILNRKSPFFPGANKMLDAETQKFFAENSLAEGACALEFCEGIQQVLGADNQSHN